MMAVSPAFLEELHLDSESVVDVALENGQLIIKPFIKPKYTLQDLLAKCDYDAPLPNNAEWLNT
jgi:antitoxin ChpS